eukprot:366101-Chlamydomonas_euryale.AAC.8
MDFRVGVRSYPKSQTLALGPKPTCMPPLADCSFPIHLTLSQQPTDGGALLCPATPRLATLPGCRTETGPSCPARSHPPFTLLVIARRRHPPA